MTINSYGKSYDDHLLPQIIISIQKMEKSENLETEENQITNTSNSTAITNATNSQSVGEQHLSNLKISKFNIDLSANLKQIAERDLYLIDKSDQVFHLLKLKQKRILLLRPRLFGKSIILDYIEAIYAGQKEIFQKLNAKMANYCPFTKKFPIIRFSLRCNASDINEFNIFFANVVKQLFTDFHILSISEQFDYPLDAFAYLLQCLTKSDQKMVILVEDLESCLTKLKFESDPFNTIKASIQNIFNIINHYKSSIEFLFIIGVFNYFEFSANFVEDMTESPELAGLVGFTHKEIADLKLLKDIPDKTAASIQIFKLENPIGGFMAALKTRIQNSIDDYCEVMEYTDIQPNINGTVTTQWMHSFIFSAGGYCFTPQKSIVVVNPFDFLCQITVNRSDPFWLQAILERKMSNLHLDILRLFQSHQSSLNIIDDVIIDLILDESNRNEPFLAGYRYLVHSGFLTYRNGKVAIPNGNIMELLTNGLIDLFTFRISFSLSNWAKNEPIRIMMMFDVFLTNAILPSVLKQKNCVTLALFFYLHLIYPNVVVKISPNGVVSCYINNIFVAYLAESDPIKYITSLDNRNIRAIVLNRVTKPKDVVNLYYMNHEKDVMTTQLNVPIFGEKAYAISKDDSGMSGISSFVDLVLEALFAACWSKNVKVTHNVVLNELQKKLPELSADASAEKKVLMSLQLLCRDGKAKYSREPKTNTVVYYISKNLYIH